MRQRRPATSVELVPSSIILCSRGEYMDIATAKKSVAIHNVITGAILKELSTAIDVAKRDYYDDPRDDSPETAARDDGFDAGLQKGFEMAVACLDRISIDDVASGLSS